MSKIYERKTPGAIERQAEGAEAGVHSGLLASDGEASDAHILNIPGGEIPESPPLLFGHDDFTGTGNLGSWRSFKKSSNGKKLGDGKLRGDFGIELSGKGSQLDWRADVDHMIGKGHIQGLSIRWEEVDEPVRRINLPSDHIAFIDPKEATGRQEWGLFFDKWRMLEGSVVTLGADPSALIGRMNESEGDVRSYWRRTVNAALEEADTVSGDLVAVRVGEEVIYVERAAYDAMLEEANSRLQMALDLHEQSHTVKQKTSGRTLGEVLAETREGLAKAEEFNKRFTERLEAENAAYDALFDGFDDPDSRVAVDADGYEVDAMAKAVRTVPKGEEKIHPEPDPALEQRADKPNTRADHPAEEADPQPQEEAITMKGLLAVIEESRKLQAAETALTIERKFDEARGRVAT